MLHWAINGRIFFLFLGYKQSTISPKRCDAIQAGKQPLHPCGFIPVSARNEGCVYGRGRGVICQCKISVQIVLNTDMEKWELFAKALWHSGMWHMFQKLKYSNPQKRKEKPLEFSKPLTINLGSLPEQELWFQPPKCFASFIHFYHLTRIFLS